MVMIEEAQKKNKSISNNRTCSVPFESSVINV